MQSFFLLKKLKIILKNKIYEIRIYIKNKGFILLILFKIYKNNLY